MLISCLTHSLDLKMKATYSLKRLLTFNGLHSVMPQNLRSYTAGVFVEVANDMCHFLLANCSFSPLTFDSSVTRRARVESYTCIDFRPQAVRFSAQTNNCQNEFPPRKSGTLPCFLYRQIFMIIHKTCTLFGLNSIKLFSFLRTI
jgi:hypothetical protein